MKCNNNKAHYTRMAISIAVFKRRPFHPTTESGIPMLLLVCADCTDNISAFHPLRWDIYPIPNEPLELLL